MLILCVFVLVLQGERIAWIPRSAASDIEGESADLDPNAGLPEGWQLVDIDDITFKGEQRKPEENEEIVYVDIGSIDRDKKIISTPQQLLGKDAPSRARRVITKGLSLIHI